MDKNKQVKVTVLLEEGHADKLAQVAERLKAHGFSTSEMLKDIGVLIGTVPVKSLKALEKVAGVAAVEEERTDYRTQ